MKMIKYFFLIFSVVVTAQQKTEQFSVYFDTDSAVLNTQSLDIINAYVINSESSRITNISLSGYCDDRGSVVYNEQLAWERVWSIIDYLKPNYAYGAFSEQAIGEVALQSSSNIKQQRTQNRRVDITVTYEEEPEPRVEPIAVAADSIEKYRSYDILKDSLQIGDKLVFNNVIFYPGRHVLRESSFPVMDSIINSLLLHKKYEIEIQGHICCLSAGVYGRDMDTGQWNLSQARAEQVKRFLVKYGVAADRLTTIGKQANFKTGKGDFYDRRVEIHITGIREDD
ncbi:OmpA family protein [Nonlabens ulvanivorans]|uniref:OmpA family protein n=2 Tax=Nonlabens ulvanivorans TaxID=906888 RepID=A0ABX5E571_NONUL|nr:OmpA family protein [Nonlabens ulvanivorans]PRX14201.1 OmpA family protein [Nonlabens ulvanivorans]